MRRALPRRRAACHVEHHLGDAQLHQRGGRRRDRPLALSHGLERHAPHQLLAEPLASTGTELTVVRQRRSSTRAVAPVRSRSSRCGPARWSAPPCPRPNPRATVRAGASAGSRTSVKNTSSNSASPVICLRGRTSMPAQVHGAEEERDALVLGGVGVGARHRIPQLLYRPPLHHTFWPFTTNRHRRVRLGW